MTDATVANDNDDTPAAVTISLTELAAGAGVDEDTLLRRIAAMFRESQEPIRLVEGKQPMTGLAGHPRPV